MVYYANVGEGLVLLHAFFPFTEPISIRCLYQIGLVLLDCFVFTVLTLLSLYTFHSSWSWMLLLSVPFFLSSSFHICPSALNTVRYKPLNDQSLSTSLCCICFLLLPILSVFLSFMQDAAVFSVFPCASCNSVLNFLGHLSIQFMIPTPQILLLTLSIWLLKKCFLKWKQLRHVKGKSSDTC